MKRNQVFVRAQDANGKWGTADVLDLDEDSFRAFVMDILFRAELVAGIGDDYVEGNHISYRTNGVFTEEEE